MFNIRQYKLIEKSIRNAKICAVVKNRNLEEINECMKYCDIIGVNRWQEFKEKLLPSNFVETIHELSLQNKNSQFHFIGHLQKNKVKDVVQYFNCIQSVDSLELLQKINSECEKINKKINIMLQINVSDDPNKYGFKIGDVNNIFEIIVGNTHVRSVQKYQNINIIGFMTITAKEEPKKIREDYKNMKKLFDQYKSQYNLTELSMGMSGDYEIAASEGATIVRLGTALFK